MNADSQQHAALWVARKAVGRLANAIGRDPNDIWMGRATDEWAAAMYVAVQVPGLTREQLSRAVGVDLQELQARIEHARCLMEGQRIWHSTIENARSSLIAMIRQSPHEVAALAPPAQRRTA